MFDSESGLSHRERATRAYRDTLDLLQMCAAFFDSRDDVAMARYTRQLMDCVALDVLEMVASIGQFPGLPDPPRTNEE